MRKNKTNSTKIILAISGLALTGMGFALRPQATPAPAAVVEAPAVTVEAPVAPKPSTTDDDLVKILLDVNPIGNPLSKEVQNIGSLLDVKDLSMNIDDFRHGKGLQISDEQEMEVAAVPEASTLSLLAFGAVALLSRRRRSRNA